MGRASLPTHNISIRLVSSESTNNTPINKNADENHFCLPSLCLDCMMIVRAGLHPRHHAQTTFLDYVSCCFPSVRCLLLQRKKFNPCAHSSTPSFSSAAKDASYSRTKAKPKWTIIKRIGTYRKFQARHEVGLSAFMSNAQTLFTEDGVIANAEGGSSLLERYSNSNHGTIRDLYDGLLKTTVKRTTSRSSQYRAVSSDASRENGLMRCRKNGTTCSILRYTSQGGRFSLFT